MIRSAAFLIGVLATAAAALAMGSPPADARGSLLVCDGATEQPFARFGDHAAYRLVPGGDFEGTTNGWSLSGGARIVAGNESFMVRGSGAKSLYLPSGSSAATPFTCVGLTDPTLRFFVLETGAASGSLKVEVEFRAILGLLPLRLELANIAGTNVWAPSNPLLNLGAALSSVTLDLTGGVRFRFTPKGSLFAPASYRIDEVFVDPFVHGGGTDDA